MMMMKYRIYIAPFMTVCHSKGACPYDWTKRWVLRLLLNSPSKSSSLREAGIAFQIIGAATMNALSPNTVRGFLAGMSRQLRLDSADLSVCPRKVVVAGDTSSIRYPGALPRSTLKVSKPTLKVILSGILSQWRAWRWGVMWQDLAAP